MRDYLAILDKSLLKEEPITGIKVLDTDIWWNMAIQFFHQQFSKSTLSA